LYFFRRKRFFKVRNNLGGQKMITIKTALTLIILSFISGLMLSKAVKLLYYYIKSIERSKRDYREITNFTDLKDWGC